MLYVAGAMMALVALVIGWSFGAVLAHKRTRTCFGCGVDRVCPKCGKIELVA